MSRLLLHLLSLAASLAWPASSKPLPVLVAVTKHPHSLYTSPFYDGANLVVDIAGPLVWSTCQRGQLPAAFPCKSDTCRLANAYPVPSCRDPGCGGEARKNSTCTAYPYNPVTGACAAGSLVHTRFVANTTDGRNPVSQVFVNAMSACGTTTNLLASLPRGASGVAGLGGSGLALMAQVASSQKVAKKFLLCLPVIGEGDGVAIFGGGPLYLLGSPLYLREGQREYTQSLEYEYTQSLEYTPLVARKGSPAPAYYVTVKYIAMESSRVPVPARALTAGGMELRTTVPFTLLRSDVYRPFVAAFGKAMEVKYPYARAVKTVAPFGLCYDSRTLVMGVPSVTLAVDGGKNWTMTEVNSMVYVGPEPDTKCLAFMEMKGVEARDGSTPAVILGGYQMENFVLQFDLEKKRLGFVRLPFDTQCSHFNFTRRA